MAGPRPGAPCTRDRPTRHVYAAPPSAALSGTRNRSRSRPRVPPSERRAATATGMPERQDLDAFRICDDEVLDVVANARGGCDERRPGRRSWRGRRPYGLMGADSFGGRDARPRPTRLRLTRRRAAHQHTDACRSRQLRRPRSRRRLELENTSNRGRLSAVCQSESESHVLRHNLSRVWRNAASIVCAM